MAFNFGAPQSTPAFGATSTPAFGAAPAATPVFGASSVPTFGAAPSPFGGGVSTPAYSFSTGGSLFGGASASTPLFGAAPAAATPFPLFGGGGATPGAFGAPSPLFGAPQQQQQQQPTALTTKENQPISHGTTWDDLSPQAQQYLLELEKVIASCRDDCRQLKADTLLTAPAPAANGLESGARALAQDLAALSTMLSADSEESTLTREVVYHLLQATEIAIYSFKRSLAWREYSSKAGLGQALPAHVMELHIGGPVALPSKFLFDAVEGFARRLEQLKASMVELEAMLGRRGAAMAGVAADPTVTLQALQAALANAHDCIMRTAARLQSLEEKVSAAKREHLARLRQKGDSADPFAQAEREERARQPQRSPLKAEAVQGSAVAAAAVIPGVHAAGTGTPRGTGGVIYSPTGLFATGGAYGTSATLFSGPGASAGGAGSRKSRAKR